MEPSDFSETQFVIGFLREYLDQPSRFWVEHILRVPSTTTEIETGADLIIKSKSKVNGNLYLQFKRSDFLENRRGLRGTQRTLDKKFFPCYRFKIYNEKRSKQFDVLRQLATKQENTCAYVAPLFHLFDEFDMHISRNNIVANSVMIDLAQFPPRSFRVKPGAKHSLLFHSKDEEAWFCSNPKQIKSGKVSPFKTIFSNNKPQGLSSVVQDIGSTIEDVDGSRQLKNILSFFLKSPVDLARFLFFKYNIIWIPNYTENE